MSTEATNNGGVARNAIDANYNTRYHSAWNGTDTERFMVVKLDKPVYLSAVEFVPAGGGNGRINDGTIYGSMDGENWEVLTRRTGITYPSQANTIEDAKRYTQNFEIAEAKEVQYVKIVADRTNGNWFVARAFNFYQDITKNPEPTASIAYSTTEKTNEPVVASTNTILVPFKNLINDEFARDTSIKIRTSLNGKKKKGEFIGAFPSYGYIKDSKDKHKLIIDESVADIIRKIFEWNVNEGLGKIAICHRLNDLGILNPTGHKN